MADPEALLDRLFNDGMNGGDDAVIDEVLHEDYRNHSLLAHGRESMRGVVADFRGSFPDIDIKVDERMVDGDRVAQRGHFTGTHTGSFMGIV
jgi:predicted ester cyclase